jgi:hypothetical protein
MCGGNVAVDMLVNDRVSLFDENRMGIRETPASFYARYSVSKFGVTSDINEQRMST